ncbi:MAG: chemotaxis protein CheW [Janthinobacterium lividum]
MLFLRFEIDGDAYALDARQIAEVLPLQPLKALPAAPGWVAGLLAYHGVPVPVVDVSALSTGHAAVWRISTRLVLVNYRPAAGGRRLLGLILERAATVVRYAPGAFVDSGVRTPHARFLGPVAVDHAIDQTMTEASAATTGDARLIQRIDVDELLGDTVRELLFAATLDR